jgi:hypothetical protein
MTADRVCEMEPFRNAVVPQIKDMESAGSAMQIALEGIEDYLSRLKEAICDDLQQIVEECCGGSGPTDISFLDLTDTPASYAGSANYMVTVNPGETGLTFTPVPDPVATAQSVERIILLAQVLNANAVTSTANFVGYGGALGANGTLAFGAIASGSVMGATARRTITSAGTAGATSSIKGGSTLLVLRGTVANEGGFRFVTYVGTSTAVAQQRAFCGVHSATGVIGNVNPTTLLNLFGFGYDSTQTTWRVIHNDGSGTASTIDLGANFPVNNSTFYKFEVECEPASSFMRYRATNLDSGVVASGVVNVDLPVATQMLTAHLWCNNGTTASAVVLNFSSFLLEMVV